MAKKKAVRGVKKGKQGNKGRKKGDRLKEIALKRVEADSNLGKYAVATRERVAGLAAKMAAEIVEEDGDTTRKKGLRRETTKIQTGGGAGVYTAQKLNGLVKQNDPKTVSFRKLKEMREHGHIQLGLTAVKAPMIRALSKFPPVVSKDPEVAGFIKAAMLPAWKALVRSSMNAEDFGYIPHEKIFEVADIEWSWVESDKEGEDAIQTSNLKGAWLPEKYKDIDPEGVKIWLDDDTGEFGGFTEKGREEMKYLTDAGNAFLYTVRKEFGNLFGKSRLARAYDPYCHYTYAEFFQGRYFERFGEPGLKVHFDPNPVQDAAGTREQEPGSQAIAAACDYKGSGVIALPSTRDDEGNLLNEFDIISDDRRGDVWIQLLEFWLKQILRSLLITDRTLTQDTRLGSYGMAKAHTETFLDNLQESVESFIGQVNRFIVPQLIDLNLGKERERAYLVPPQVNREHQAILYKVFEALLKKDGGVHGAIDALEIMKELNIPTIDVTEAEPERPTELPDNEATQKRIDEETERVAQLAKSIGTLDDSAKKMMSAMEADLDKAAAPVRKKIFGFEDRMKKVALDFVDKAKLDDTGRIKKSANEKALSVAKKKIDAIAAEMEKWFGSEEGQKASNYLATFGDRGIADFEKLSKIYGADLPAGWKSNIRDEKLARGFGAGLRSFLDNIKNVAGRTKAGIKEAMTLGVDRNEVVNAVKRNGRFLRHAAERAVTDGIKGLKGSALKAGNFIKSSLPTIATGAGDKPELWGSAMTALATAAIAREALKGDDAKQIKDIGKAATTSVEAVKLLDEDDTLPARLKDTNTHHGYVDLTVEGPARGAYRWALWSGAGLAGWNLFKSYRNSKTEDVDGVPSEASLKYDGVLADLNWWDAEGLKAGRPEPLQQYGFHYGDRDFYFPMPEEWAEKQGLAWKK